MDYTKFWGDKLPKYARLPRRRTADYAKWRKSQNQDPRLPVNPYPGEVFNPDMIHFKSVRDMVNFVMNSKGIHPTLVLNNPETIEEPSTERHWHFNTNQALALFQDGWSEGWDAVKYAMEQASTAAMMANVKVSTFGRELHGADVDVGLFLRGEPECMLEFHDEVSPVLHLDLEIDYYLSAAMSPDEIMYRGSVIAAAVMALRRMGVFVTMKISSYQEVEAWRDRNTGPERRNCKTKFTCEVMNQDMTENLTDVLMTIAHPAFYRRIWFMAYTMASGCIDKGLGWNWRSTRDFDTTPGSGKIVIPGHFFQKGNTEDEDVVDWPNAWSSPKAAEALVKMLFQCAAPK